MARLKTFTIEALNYPHDMYEVGGWRYLYVDTPGYEAIEKFILEGQIYHSLSEVIDTNYEAVAIGSQERKYTLVIKVKNEIIAWLDLDVFKLDTPNPEMFITHICLRPDYHNKGYGTAILKELFNNIENYVGVRPCYIFAKIDKDNIASQNLFRKFNFSFKPIICTDWLSAHTSEPKLVSESGSQGFGE